MSATDTTEVHEENVPGVFIIGVRLSIEDAPKEPQGHNICL